MHVCVLLPVGTHPPPEKLPNHFCGLVFCKFLQPHAVYPSNLALFVLIGPVQPPPFAIRNGVNNAANSSPLREPKAFVWHVPPHPHTCAWCVATAKVFVLNHDLPGEKLFHVISLPILMLFVPAELLPNTRHCSYRASVLRSDRHRRKIHHPFQPLRC